MTCAVVYPCLARWQKGATSHCSCASTAAHSAGAGVTPRLSLLPLPCFHTYLPHSYPCPDINPLLPACLSACPCLLDPLPQHKLSHSHSDSHFSHTPSCLTFTWVGILIGMLYYAQPNDGISLRNRLNLCYVSLSFVVLMPHISMGLYTSDKKFYLADASSKLYRPLAYYLAKVRRGPGASPAQAI